MLKISGEQHVVNVFKVWVYFSFAHLPSQDKLVEILNMLQH